MARHGAILDPLSVSAGDQSPVIAFLESPSTHGGEPVERIDTHTAIVFLAGERAFKMKRAVQFDYVDFSTVERRRIACEDEVRLNRRTAPSLYRRAVPVSRGDRGLAIDGPGEIVEWLVEMNRFDQSALFDRLAVLGTLDLDRMPELAEAIAAFHESAERRLDHGGADAMKWVVDGNASGFTEFGAGWLDALLCARVTRDSYSVLERCNRLLDARRRAGYVRHCHGDLHLGNIVLLAGRATLFDGVEFNDEIACIDVMYDLAFLLMDLWHRRLPAHANAVLNRYLSVTGDIDALALLPLFLACRAAVRAKTTATAARVQRDADQGRRRQALANDYLAWADRFLHPALPCLVAIGGFSGSGKSTTAMRLAPAIGAAPGAVVFRSDEIRKRLCGVDRFDRLVQSGYSEDVSRRVYETVGRFVGTAVRAGHAVIADAVYASPAERQAIERIAAESSVPFVGLWLDAPEPMLIDRVWRRRADASDADADVIRRQRAQGVGVVNWHRVDAAQTSERVLEAAARAVRSVTDASRNGRG
jgi:aminoglycoside phosphotransferase family enzyme/predicted kinase